MRRIWAWVIRIITVVAVLVALLMLVPSLLGYQRYVIESGSMEPELPVGSVVYSEATDSEDLNVGDIITFEPPREYEVDEVVTHRIFSIERPKPNTQRADGGLEPGRVFTTKGDANEHPDPWRFVLDDDEAALEKAHLPYLGYIYLALAIPVVRLLVIVIPAILIAVLTAVSVWRSAGKEAEAERARIERERQEREASVTEKEPV